MKHAMSIRLVEGGLAMVAGQSYIAGPSVCFAFYHVRFLCEPHLPFFRIGNKIYLPAGGTWQQMPTRRERIHTTYVRSVAGVYASSARAPVKQLV